jgi:hypothetical protein
MQLVITEMKQGAEFEPSKSSPEKTSEQKTNLIT